MPQVDLSREYVVERVTIVTRFDCCLERYKDVQASISYVYYYIFVIPKTYNELIVKNEKV